MAKKFDNRTVIEKYFSGYDSIESHTGNLLVSNDGKRLMNYSTCLVERSLEHGYIYNATKYSVTTSKIQTYIKGYLNYREHVTVSGVQLSTSYLNDLVQPMEVK